MLGDVAEGAVASDLTLSLMIIDSSITVSPEGPWLAGSVHTVCKIAWQRAHTHTHKFSLRGALFFVHILFVQI